MCNEAQLNRIDQCLVCVFSLKISKIWPLTKNSNDSLTLLFLEFVGAKRKQQFIYAALMNEQIPTRLNRFIWKNGKKI